MNDASTFKRLYGEVVEQILSYWQPEMQAEIARHNPGWGEGKTDFRIYLQRSWLRYAFAFQSISTLGNSLRICDVGGFWGAFPLTLRRMGFDVAMTEALGYYGKSFDNLFAFIREQGVHIHDVDLFKPDATLIGPFDFISIMAVVEHYPHSLRPFIANVNRMLRPKGVAYVEVPNIAVWHKRKRLLFGQTPLTPYQDVYESETPFVGHHREYSLDDVHQLVQFAGWRILRQVAYDYSDDRPWYWKLYDEPIGFTIRCLSPEARECLAVACCRDLD